MKKKQKKQKVTKKSQTSTTRSLKQYQKEVAYLENFGYYPMDFND